jgi:CheY-like chemotaxis protein/prolyl-tRNA editing enzyme YbaK/EbsC (Cys-tRNA(Pro) deacylase)
MEVLTMAMPGWLKHIFNRYGVSYEEYHHPPVFSASALAQVEHVTGYRVAKTVFLTAPDHRPVAVVVPSCARLDVEQVKKVLGIPDLRLATETEIAAWFKGCQPGAVPPLRLRGDERVLLDRSLAHLGKIVFAAGTPEDAVAVRFRDWYRAVRPGVGRFTRARNGRNDAPPPTVLVVEDETDTNELLCRLLESKGYACHGVAEGNRALALAPEVGPAAILLDLMLPDRSGFEVYEELRRTGPLKRIPVIVVSALDDEATRQRGWQLGADAHLTKPFLPEKLVAELQGALESA